MKYVVGAFVTEKHLLTPIFSCFIAFLCLIGQITDLLLQK